MLGGEVVCDLLTETGYITRRWVWNLQLPLVHVLCSFTVTFEFQNPEPSVMIIISCHRSGSAPYATTGTSQTTRRQSCLTQQPSTSIGMVRTCMVKSAWSICMVAWPGKRGEYMVHARLG